MRGSREAAGLLVVGLACLVASGLRPYDRTTWVLEVSPILLGVPVLLATRTRFPLTPLAYRLVFAHALVLMVGGHYTYERVPIGDWFKSAFHLARNHYDRFGHLVQGFVPAVTALVLGQGADAFLATQGDPWDTQEDMFLALVGAVLSQLLLARLHDRELAERGVR